MTIQAHLRSQRLDQDCYNPSKPSQFETRDNHIAAMANTINKTVTVLTKALREISQNDNLDDQAVLNLYPTVFDDPEASAAVHVITSLLSHNLIGRLHVRLDMDTIRPFLENFTQDEIAHRFEKINQWVTRHHKTNHDGTILTPPIFNFLSQKIKLEVLTGELDVLRQQTRNGGFDLNNILQRDLEFRRFSHEKTWQLEPESYVLRGRYPPPLSTEELYCQFKQLDLLPAHEEIHYQINNRQAREIKRVAYECISLLQFLNKFKARTSKNIVVIGNDRYGRQWNVEPIEEFLKDGFITRYDRVRSGTSMRLTVPEPFPDKFIRYLSDEMPHVVIVDGAHAPSTAGSMQISRGARSYAHWFAAFNDVRVEGNVTKYRANFGFPINHLDELAKWHEYVSVRQYLGELVTPGPTYSVATWAPELQEKVIMGDITMHRNPKEFKGEDPLVVLVNPIFYSTEGDDIDTSLIGTTPRYFDDPDMHESSEVMFGFGTYGLETRVKGISTARFVATIQKHVKEEISKQIACNQELTG